MPEGNSVPEINNPSPVIQKEVSANEGQALRSEYVATIISRKKWLQFPQTGVSTDERGSRTVPTVAADLVAADNARLEALRTQLIADGISIPSELQVQIAELREKITHLPDGSVVNNDYNREIADQIKQLEAQDSTQSD